MCVFTSYFLSSIHRGHMDIYASAALTGLGYSLSKQRDSLKETERIQQSISPSEKPSNRSMYRSDILVNTDVAELSRGTKSWNKAQNPIETGVIPRPAYADQFAEPRFNEAIDTSSFQSLSGEVYKTGDLKHNNMQKFTRMKDRAQYTENFDNTSPILENRTGRGYNIQRKTEVPCFFEPTSGFAHVNGMPDTTDFFRERTENPRRRANDFPIDQVQVGPGLGKGFTAEPSGGFQQAYSLDIVRPKNVDDLRVATKPRIVYELPPQAPPKSQIGQSYDVSHIGEVSKNLPDKFFEQTEDMFLKTSGAYFKDRQRPIQEVKPTSRVDSHIEYEGNAHNGTTEPGVGHADDFRKDSVMTFKNNREVTEERTILNNVTSVVKAIVAPILDLFRHTTKEYLTDSARPYGNMSAQIPDKATTYDPVNHILRTTIRETTTPDTTITNLRGANMVSLPLDDDAKTTVRETTKEEDYSRNISAHTYTVTVYNTESVARTTVRNITPESSSMYGFMGGNNLKTANGAYHVTDIDLKNNIKQYTLESDSMYGFMGGKDLKTTSGAYNVTDIDLKNNVKQYTSDIEYEGIAGSKTDLRPKSDEAERNARIDGTRDFINEEAGHTPNGAGGFTSLEPDKFVQEAKRLVSDDFAVRETHNKTAIWQQTAQDIPKCSITHQYDYLNANENRLDPKILSSLSTNPYNLQINPVVL